MVTILPACRKALGALLASAFAVSLALVAAPDGAAKPSRGQTVPLKADRDADKVFDDLETRLPALANADRVSVIAVLGAPATGERVRGLERAVGQFAVSHRFSVVDGFAAALTKGQIRALAQRADVVHVEANSTVRALNDDAQSSFGVDKARGDLPALDGDADGNGAAYSAGDLVAAVIDTGIDAVHLDLDDGKVIAFKDFVNNRTTPYDDNGHGTHVAATIAGDGEARADGLHEGVAPGAALVGVKVLDSAGSGTMADITAAIDWVVQNKDTYGIEAINLSLGAAGCGDGTDAASLAVNNAHLAGLVVAVAAGNEGPGTCTVGAPAAAANAVTVGAMADVAAGGFRQAWFSSRGPTADGRVKPDVSAPGVAITSAQANTVSGYVSQDGTSMATPFVAGVALLMRDANPGLTPQQVKDKLVATAVDWARGGDNRTAASTGADIDYGAGRLDAYAALAAAGAPLSAPPVAPSHTVLEGSLSGPGAVADYKIEVASADYPLAATLIISGLSAGSGTSPDFDLYLFDPAGTLVARAETYDRQEDIAHRPTAAGTYTLRVRSYNGSGGFFVDVSAGLATVAADTTAPTITAVSPASGATGVAPATNVSVTFSEPMDKASAQSAFTLVRSTDGTAVAGTFAWSGDTMTFDPSSSLIGGAEYAATVSTAAKDVAGNRIAVDMVWTFKIETTATAFPGSTTIGYGTLRSGDASRLKSDDDLYYQVNSTTSGTRATDWYGRMTSVSNSLASLKVTYKGKSSASCTQTLYLYNWTQGSWIKLESRTVGTSEVSATVTAAGSLADYVSGTSGDGDVVVRVRCTRGDSTSFYTSGDLMKIVYTKP